MREGQSSDNNALVQEWKLRRETWAAECNLAAHERQRNQAENNKTLEEQQLSQRAKLQTLSSKFATLDKLQKTLQDVGLSSDYIMRPEDVTPVLYKFDERFQDLDGDGDVDNGETISYITGVYYRIPEHRRAGPDGEVDHIDFFDFCKWLYDYGNVNDAVIGTMAMGRSSARDDAVTTQGLGTQLVGNVFGIADQVLDQTLGRAATQFGHSGGFHLADHATGVVSQIETQTGMAGEVTGSARTGTFDAENLSARTLPTNFEQFRIFLSRAWTQFCTEFYLFMTGLFQIFALLSMIGPMLASSQPIDTDRFVYMINLVNNYIASACPIAAINSNRVFGPERENFYREASSGTNKAAFFLAKDLLFTVSDVAMRALVGTLIWYHVFPLKQSFGNFYLIAFGVEYNSSGIGFIVSICFEGKMTLLLLISLPLILVFLFMGVSMPYGQQPWLFQRMIDMSYTNWAAKGILMAEDAHLSGEAPHWNRFYTSDFGWGHEGGWFYDSVDGAFGFCVFGLMFSGVMYRVIALFCLYNVNKHKQI